MRKPGRYAGPGVTGWTPLSALALSLPKPTQSHTRFNDDLNHDYRRGTLSLKTEQSGTWWAPPNATVNEHVELVIAKDRGMCADVFVQNCQIEYHAPCFPKTDEPYAKIDTPSVPDAESYSYSFRLWFHDSRADGCGGGSAPGHSAGLLYVPGS